MKPRPPACRWPARAFLGFDAESGGRIDGSALQFIFPYANGPFRDTLEFDQRDGTRHFRIEAGQPDGSWKHFARYEIRRK